MGGPKVEQPQISPEQLAIQERARNDRINEVRDRLSDDTRETLIRFGRRQAMTGTGGGLSGPSSGFDLNSLMSGGGLLGGRGRLEVLRRAGRI